MTTIALETKCAYSQNVSVGVANIWMTVETVNQVNFIKYSSLKLFGLGP